MSVKYNIVERGNPSNQEAPKKFYPSVVSSGKITEREVAKQASQRSTVSSADTLAVLENFLSIISEELARGNIVELGEFGSFWLRIESEGAVTKEEAGASQITNILPRFSPGREFQQALNIISFEKA